MIVVCDTSPITNLAAVGRLELLKELFGLVLICESFRDELQADGGVYPGSNVASLDWIEVRAAANQMLVDQLRKTIHLGEAESFVVALECQADLVLLDDADGRSAAQQCGLTVMGTLGVLIRAKRTGFIQVVKPILDDLTAHGFFVRDSVAQQVLKIVGE